MEVYNESHIIDLLRQPERQREAFGTLVDHYSQQLYWQIRRMVGSHEDADDVLQNTFVKAWTNLDGFRGDARLSTWLYRIALNETLNFLQKKKQTLSLDTDCEALPLHSLTADEYFDGDETEKQLQQAVAALPEKQRMVFTLKYFQEMKYDDMSEVLQTSVGALKASYHHAVRKVYEFFNQTD